MMMERIRREHSYMVRLLSILRHKLDLVKSEQPINYSLLKEIVKPFRESASPERGHSVPPLHGTLRR